jgi:hypothetical protein
LSPLAVAITAKEHAELAEGPPLPELGPEEVRPNDVYPHQSRHRTGRELSREHVSELPRLRRRLRGAGSRREGDAFSIRRHRLRHGRSSKRAAGIADVFSKHDTTTPAGTIVRLHGPDRQAIEEATDSAWDGIVEPRPESIQAAVNIVRANLRLGHKTFVNINNHFEGHAPLTAERLLTILREKKPELV